ncbi:unnamed protein product [Zymoseptoria tritici ST99CH_1A5]|uniref:Uncharacterized protein n=2 Tax=Zymoseptoria tritici TaxID=1047171 RepID=A0A1X7S2H9_ZYMT9|nr:unnamed protein product [Zymoseptoria tritici ST99CH_3D7]SMY27289.1 unnamed protein product [Zymoseptoria tritici ST99CH_1A5]
MSEKQEQKSTKKNEKNVLGGELAFLTKGEGFYKDGYCRSSSKDDNGPRGNYSVAATLTHGFLQSEYGDDPPYKGHRASQKMCLSAHDFLEAIREMGPDAGPKVDLQATHERALEVVKLADLKKYGGSVAPGRARGGGL